MKYFCIDVEGERQGGLEGWNNDFFDRKRTCIPYRDCFENILDSTKIYDASELINIAYELFLTGDTNSKKNYGKFCGRLSRPINYTVQTKIVEKGEEPSDREWSATATPLQKAQKFTTKSLDVIEKNTPLTDSYSEQIPYDLLDVVNFFRGTNINTFSEEYYGRILNNNAQGLNYVSKGDTIYDIGVGDGNQLIDLSNAVGSTGKIFGIDIYPEMIIKSKNIVKKNSLENVHIAFGDGRDISNTPLKYNTADKVLIFGVLEYLDKTNVNTMLDEAVNACKSDGKIILNTVAQEYFIQSAEHFGVNEQLVSMIKKCTMPVAEGIIGTLFSKEMIEAEFNKRGFSTTIDSYSNRDVMPIDMVADEPDYIKNLPIEHFVVAEAS